MRHLAGTVVLIWCISTLATALPPTPLTTGIERGLSELDPEGISTDLTLGRNWGSAIGSAVHNIQKSVKDAIPGHPSEGSSSHAWVGEYSGHPHQTSSLPLLSPPKPFLPTPKARESSSSAPPPQTRPPVLALTEIRAAREVWIDTHFSELLRDSRNPDRILLPPQMIYARTPWIGDIYHHLLSELHRKRPFRKDEILIADDVLPDVLGGRRSFFVAKGHVYLLRLQANQRGSTDAREILFKYHNKLEWSGRTVTYVVSFWSTADHGSSLALLGLYSMAKRPFKAMIHLPGMQTFSIRASVAGNHRLYLVPAEPE